VSRPKRCTANLFDGPEWRCHRDEGHFGDHVHYNEDNDGLAGWRNAQDDVWMTFAVGPDIIHEGGRP
jgi:hypothetical protein